MLEISGKRKWMICLSAWILYLILIVPATLAIGSGSTMTMIIPVALTGAFLGSRVGISAAGAGVGYNTVILLLLIDISAILTNPFIVGSALIIFIGFLAGKMRDMSDRLVKEVRRRKKAEDSLTKSKKRIQKSRSRPLMPFLHHYLVKAGDP